MKYLRWIILIAVGLLIHFIYSEEIDGLSFYQKIMMFSSILIVFALYQLGKTLDAIKQKIGAKTEEELDQEEDFDLEDI